MGSKGPIHPPRRHIGETVAGNRRLTVFLSSHDQPPATTDGRRFTIVRHLTKNLPEPRPAHSDVVSSPGHAYYLLGSHEDHNVSD